MPSATPAALLPWGIRGSEAVTGNVPVLLGGRDAGGPGHFSLAPC